LCFVFSFKNISRPLLSDSNIIKFDFLVFLLVLHKFHIPGHFYNAIFFAAAFSIIKKINYHEIEGFF